GGRGPGGGAGACRAQDGPRRCRTASPEGSTTARRASRACRARQGRQVEDGPSRGQSMDVVAIAVTGASGLVGQRLLPKLAEDEGVTHLIGLDVHDPRRRVRNLDFHRVDIGGAELKPLLETAHLLVHLPTVVAPLPHETPTSPVNLPGTRPPPPPPPPPPPAHPP